MKIFTSAQIHELDKYTIEHEPIAAIDLMERAALAIAGAIGRKWGSATPVVVFAGPGNNGGDALAVARLLADRGYKVDAFLFNITGKLSAECAANKARLESGSGVASFTEVTQEFDPPELTADVLVVDGLFGSGANKPLTGGFASLVKYINKSKAMVASIDVPSGLMAENNTYNVLSNIVRADVTLTLQQPKLAFFFGEFQDITGKVEVLDIGISSEGMEATDARFRVTEESQVREMLRPRGKFAHKGAMGSALLVAGSYGMAGAAILAARACLRSGAGKVTVVTPSANNDILQTAVPEAVVMPDKNSATFATPVDSEPYGAMGIGPGIGKDENTSIAMIAQLRRTQCPIVADADAINILSSHRAWIAQLPKGTILTPHPKELDRLCGSSTQTYERIEKALELASKHEVYVVLKGRNTAICCPNGNVTINPTGNEGMATGGTGDVLTGIITALLARGYSREEACIAGTYIHGLAGDMAADDIGTESLIAGDVIDYLPKAFKHLYGRR